MMYRIITLLLFVSVTNGMVEKIKPENINYLVFDEPTTRELVYTAKLSDGTKIQARAERTTQQAGGWPPYDYEAVSSWRFDCCTKVYSDDEAYAIFKKLRDMHGERELQKRKKIEEMEKTEFIQWMIRGVKENKIVTNGGCGYGARDDDGKYRYTTAKPKSLSEHEFEKLLSDLIPRFYRPIIVVSENSSCWKRLMACIYNPCARSKRVHVELLD